MRILVCRLGAWGDSIITTPLVRYLKQQGHEVYYLGSEQAQAVLENNPNVDKFILHVKDSIASNKLEEYFEATATAHDCEKIIDLCESIEVNLCLSPSQPAYNYPKYERMDICNKNYYVETFDIARQQVKESFKEAWKFYDPKLMQSTYQPQMFFTESEEKFIMDDIRTPYMGEKKILWGLSGSSRQKTYPPAQMLEVIKAFPDCIHITVGDEVCRLLEWPFTKVKGFENVITRAGKYTMRESILATKYVDLVIAPDTGLLHGSGCFDTPKIGLMTNTTIENITKHFKNDYSLESKGVACSPCFHLVYKSDVQAQLDSDQMTPLCMSMGMGSDRLIERIKEVFDVRE